MASAALPILLAALRMGSGYIQHRGKNRREEQAHNQNRGGFERNATAQAARSRLAQAIMGGYGIESVVPQKQRDYLATPTQYPKFTPGQSNSEFFGGELEGALDTMGGPGGSPGGPGALQGSTASMSGGPGPGPGPEAPGGLPPLLGVQGGPERPSGAGFEDELLYDWLLSQGVGGR